MSDARERPGTGLGDPPASALASSASTEATASTGVTSSSDRFEEALLAVDRITAKDIMNEASAGATPVQAIENLVLPALTRIGQGWEKGTTALAQVYMAGRICEELVDSMLPAGVREAKARRKMAIVVLEDFHVLGKRIVYSVLRASGFDLLDYGRQDVAGLVRRVEEDGIEVLFISTLMLPSALRVAKAREKLDHRTKLVVGGAPFRLDEELWREVGADAMGRTAADAIRIAKDLSGGRP